MVEEAPTRGVDSTRIRAYIATVSLSRLSEAESAARRPAKFGLWGDFVAGNNWEILVVNSITSILSDSSSWKKERRIEGSESMALSSDVSTGSGIPGWCSWALRPHLSNQPAAVNACGEYFERVPLFLTLRKESLIPMTSLSI